MDVEFNFHSGGMGMSFFDKMFASVGIGAAKVDTILTNDRLIAGDEVFR